MRSRLFALVRALPLLAIIALAGVIVELPATTNAGPAAQPGTLSLVYLNREQPEGSEVWVTSLDGTNQRTVGTFGKMARELDVRGSAMAVANGEELVIVDLTGGDPKRVPANRVTSGYITEQGAVLYATRHGCGGPDDPKITIGRVDAATGARSDVAELELTGAEILWHNQATNEIILTPRGCDPGIWELRTLDATTGAEKATAGIRGCGWATVSPNGKQALITEGCGLLDAPAFYAYDVQGKSQREVRLTDGMLSSHALVYAPDGTRAAFGTAFESMNSPAFQGNPTGKAKSGGIWLLDTARLARTRLWQDEGLESWAVDWSPDGTRLLVASTEAQGRCRYFVVDVATVELKPVEGISGCGSTGTMIGFATLS